MLKTIVTLVRGAAFRAEEEFADRSALLILDQQIRDSALQVPLDRMLIETDSPFLAPVPYRGKRNEPAFVKEVARQIGELRGMAMEEVAEQTTANFQEFFGKNIHRGDAEAQRK